MPHYSGKKWSELEDIWPKEVRITDETYEIMGLFSPAWAKTRRFIIDTLQIKGLLYEHFFLLCWLHRVQDGKDGLAFQPYQAMKGVNLGGRIWYGLKSPLHKYGLIEALPIRNRAYRVTELGKVIIKKFIENVHLSRQELEENLKRYDAYKIHGLSDHFGLVREDEEYSKSKQKDNQEQTGPADQ